MNVTSPPESRLYGNGFNASTGRPLLPPLTAKDVVRLARGETWPPEVLADLKARHQYATEDQMEVVHGVDPCSLADSGWGVIFAHDTPAAIREAIQPLLAHRRAAASSTDARRYRELMYCPGESKAKFLARHGVGPGPVDPTELPYYLLLIGGPRTIGFGFQHQLDVQYAVGRIAFDDPRDLAAYAASVVAAETEEARRPRTMALFGVANQDDLATERSLRNLLIPVHEHLAGLGSVAGAAGKADDHWTLQTALGDAATKARLSRWLGGGDTPALLFTASHGVGFDPDDPRQAQHQGALLCQDWPGPRQWRAPIPQDHYFAADDVDAHGDIAGMIAFHFACYGAGTPRFDQFAQRVGSRAEIAPRSFVARLPQRLLAHPSGGALAVVGHVDRAWSFSFDWPQAPRQLGVFTSAFERLLEGYPVGAAMEYFGQRYAELSADLSSELEEIAYGMEPDFLTLPSMWTANNDARCYVVLGDPAVRLRTRPAAAPQRAASS